MLIIALLYRCASNHKAYGSAGKGAMANGKYKEMLRSVE